MTYDTKCEALARTFLEDHIEISCEDDAERLESEVDGLAQHIQEAIEEYLKDVKRHNH